jgi:D-glycero-alpha-D-manno-heptose 1-phosphate guanylyltransferase
MSTDTDVIVLAGGRGTRLREQLGGLPKILAPVCGRPLLLYLLDTIVVQPIGRLFITLNASMTLVQEIVGETYRQTPIIYIFEEDYLGTGGAIRNALPRTSGEESVVVNGDTILDISLRSFILFHRTLNTALSAAHVYRDQRGRFGASLIEGSYVRAFGEKAHTGPGWINAGVYVIKKHFPWPANLPHCFSFEKGILSLAPMMKIGAYRTDGYFIDVGVPTDLCRAQLELPERWFSAENQLDD